MSDKLKLFHQDKQDQLVFFCFHIKRTRKKLLQKCSNQPHRHIHIDILYILYLSICKPTFLLPLRHHVVFVGSRRKLRFPPRPHEHYMIIKEILKMKKKCIRDIFIYLYFLCMWWCGCVCSCLLCSEVCMCVCVCGEVCV